MEHSHICVHLWLQLRKVLWSYFNSYVFITILCACNCLRNFCKNQKKILSFSRIYSFDNLDNYWNEMALYPRIEWISGIDCFVLWIVICYVMYQDDCVFSYSWWLPNYSLRSVFSYVYNCCFTLLSWFVWQEYDINHFLSLSCSYDVCQF